MILLSCKPQKVSKESIEQNDVQIANEFDIIKKKFNTLPSKNYPLFIKSDIIVKSYNELKVEYLQGDLKYDSIFKHIKILFKTGAYRDYTFIRSDFNTKDIDVVFSRIQFITLIGLKNLMWETHEYEYQSNICDFEVYTDKNKIKIIVSKLDTTEPSQIFIGRLENNSNKFIDTFIQADMWAGYGYISRNVNSEGDSIEGLYIVPTINGNFDTIRFKKKINGY